MRRYPVASQQNAASLIGAAALKMSAARVAAALQLDPWFVRNLKAHDRLK